MVCPDRKFENKEVILLKRLTKGCTLDLIKGTNAPIFQGTSDRDSAVIFNCADEETVKCLKKPNESLVYQRRVTAACAGC